MAHIPPPDVVCPANINSTPEIESWDWVNAVKAGCFVAFSCFFRSSEKGSQRLHCRSSYIMNLAAFLWADSNVRSCYMILNSTCACMNVTSLQYTWTRKAHLGHQWHLPSPQAVSCTAEQKVKLKCWSPHWEPWLYMCVYICYMHL